MGMSWHEFFQYVQKLLGAAKSNEIPVMIHRLNWNFESCKDVAGLKLC